MGKDTKIEWADHTWNPWSGCTKVSTGCKYCYMFRVKVRWKKQDPSALYRARKQTSNEPLKWNRNPSNHGNRVFACSMSDWFHPDADAWRADAWDIVRRCQDLTFMILTKRPERIAECLPDDWGDGWPNVWLGVSAENQEQYGTRRGWLEIIPAAVLFYSFEPLLGPIGTGWDSESGRPNVRRWAIIGGESGGPTTSRPMRIDWAESIVSQCKSAGVPVFLKQTGAWEAWGTDDRRPKRLAHVSADGYTRYDGDGKQVDPIAIEHKYVGGKGAHELPSGKYLEFPA